MTDGIIVGVNGSPASIDALRTGSHIAIALGLNLSVVAEWDYETPMLDYVVLDRAPEADADQVLAAAGELVFGLEWPRGFTARSVRGDGSHKIAPDDERHRHESWATARAHVRIDRIDRDRFDLDQNLGHPDRRYRQ